MLYDVKKSTLPTQNYPLFKFPEDPIFNIKSIPNGFSVLLINSGTIGTLQILRELRNIHIGTARIVYLFTACYMMSKSRHFQHRIILFLNFLRILFSILNLYKITLFNNQTLVRFLSVFSSYFLAEW